MDFNRTPRFRFLHPAQAGICSSTHPPSPWEALNPLFVLADSLMIVCIVYSMLLSCYKHCKPCPGMSVRVLMLIELYVWCGSSNPTFFSHPAQLMRDVCSTSVKVFSWWEWADSDCSRLHRRIELTPVQVDEKSHLSHAWQGLKAPEVYLVMFHCLPLNCSYASLQLRHSLKTFTVRSDAIQRLRPLAKRLGIPFSLCVKPNTDPE